MILCNIIMYKAIINTRSPGSNIQENLSSLDTYIKNINYGIEIFNNHDKINFETLTTSGERITLMYFFINYIPKSKSILKNLGSRTGSYLYRKINDNTDKAI